MNKTCNYLIISCMDFRIQDFVRTWAEENLKGEKYDYIGFSGSTKNLEIIISQINLSVQLHSIRNVILIHHQDCGAYGGKDTYPIHETDLHRAKEQILKLHPELLIEAYYLKLSGEFNKVY